MGEVGLSRKTDQAGAGEKYPNSKVCYRLLPPDQDREGMRGPPSFQFFRRKQDSTGHK